MAISATSKLGASNSLTKQRTAESILEFCKNKKKTLYSTIWGYSIENGYIHIR